MDVVYKDSKKFSKEDLEFLFNSVKWESGKYGKELVIAMQNSSRVFSAWANDKLVGLINAISDEILVVYIPYLLIHPNYQNRGIGRNLIKLIATEYKNYHIKYLLSESNTVEFYEKCGLSVVSDAYPMEIN